MDHLLCQRNPNALHKMASYEVTPSPDYIPALRFHRRLTTYLALGTTITRLRVWPGGARAGTTLPPIYLPYVLEPVYPEYIPPEDDVFLAEEQPLHAVTSPTTESLGYIPKSDLEEDPEEDPSDYATLPRQWKMMMMRRRREALQLRPLYPTFTPCLPRSEDGCVLLSPIPSREVRESSAQMFRSSMESRELDYGITDTWDDLVGAIDEIAPTTIEGVNQRVTDLATIVEEETTSMYGIMEDAQDDRSQLRGRVNLLYRDRPVHRRLAVMIEREAKMAREAWGLSMDASDYARSDVMSLRTTVVAQSALISELQSADHRRQRVISELLASDHKRQVQLTKTLRLLKGL
ncbi:hypothetical protein Tco_0349741 [Tanacetum coccineum]